MSVITCSPSNRLFRKLIRNSFLPKMCLNPQSVKGLMNLLIFSCIFMVRQYFIFSLSTKERIFCEKCKREDEKVNVADGIGRAVTAFLGTRLHHFTDLCKAFQKSSWKSENMYYICIVETHAMCKHMSSLAGRS